jgi:sec-independent protein translocase protein TatA
MLGFKGPELVLVAALLLLFFGKDKLPGLAKSIGESVNELKKGFNGEYKTEKSTAKEKGMKMKKSK